MAPSAMQKMAAGIAYMPDALATSDPSAIASINLHSNMIVRIEGLDSFSQLRHLNLSSNRIENISGLNGLVNLESLNLSTNRITVVSGLHDLHNLKKLLLSYNEISSLVGLGQEFFQPTNSFLHTLELHGNKISDPEHLHFVRHVQSLRVLSLRNDSHCNPICSLPNYATRVRQILPQISVLDGGSQFVNTPRIDNALQMVLSRSRQHSDSTVPPWEHLVQGARLDSLETTVDQVLMTMHALANKASPRDLTAPGKAVCPTPDRITPSRVEQQDATTITGSLDIQQRGVGTSTDCARTEHKNASVGTDGEIQRKDAQVLTEHRMGLIDVSVATEGKPLLKNASMLTDEDHRHSEIRSKLLAAEASFLEVENSLKRQLSAAHQFIKESADQSKGTMSEIKQLKDKEFALSQELESSKRSLEALKLVANVSKEKEASISLDFKTLQQQEVSLRNELQQSKSVIENLQFNDKIRHQHFNNEITKHKQYQHELETKCQKLSQDRSALKELTKKALQKQKQLINEIETYRNWNETQKVEYQSCLESRELTARNLKHQLDASNSQIQILNGKEASLQKELQSAKSKIQRQAVQIAELSERLKLSTEENHDFQSQYQHLKESGITKMKILEDHSMQIRELQEVIHKLNREKEDWKMVEDSLCQRVEDYRERCHQAEKDLREYEEALESSRTERKELEASLKHLKKEVRQYDLTKESVEDEMSKIKIRHDEAVSSLSQELCTVKTRLQESEAAAAMSLSKVKDAEALVAETNRQRDLAIARANQCERDMRVLLKDVELKKKEVVNFVRSWVS